MNEPNVEIENHAEIMEACKANTTWHTEMMTDVCYVPIETIDDVLAQLLASIAENRQKDAEVERLKDELFTQRDIDEAYERGKMTGLHEARNAVLRLITLPAPPTREKD